MRGLIGDIFCGVWACDQLPFGKPFHAPSFFIVNTHPASYPGEHWLALTLEEDGTGTFFDSFGYPPHYSFYPSDIFAFLRDNCTRIRYNTKQIQHELSSACGHHCVYYLTHRARGFTFNQVLSLYTDDKIRNDCKAMAFVKKHKKYSCYKSCMCYQHSACSLKVFCECHNMS